MIITCEHLLTSDTLFIKESFLKNESTSAQQLCLLMNEKVGALSVVICLVIVGVYYPPTTNSTSSVLRHNNNQKKE